MRVVDHIDGEDRGETPGESHFSRHGLGRRSMA
jgi:hypothetical protein